MKWLSAVLYRFMNFRTKNWQRGLYFYNSRSLFGIIPNKISLNLFWTLEHSQLSLFVEDAEGVLEMANILEIHLLLNDLAYLKISKSAGNIVFGAVEDDQKLFNFHWKI